MRKKVDAAERRRKSAGATASAELARLMREQDRDLAAERRGTIDPLARDRAAAALRRAASAGETDPRPARHDARYVPAAAEWHDESGTLLGHGPGRVLTSPTEAERRAARAIARKLTARYWPPELHAVVAEAHRILFGHAPGERWKAVLAGELREQVRVRAEARLRGGEPGELSEILSPGEIVARVREQVPGVPAELTPAVVEVALEQVTLGRGGGRGGRGVSVDRWVAGFAERIGRR